MNIKFLWWVNQVTWSKVTFIYKWKQFLVDYWMIQEWWNTLKIYKENLKLHWIIPKEIDYILLTHSHIDHSGMIPFLVKKGFRWKILVEKANKKILNALWKDSLYVSEKDYDFLIKKWISKNTIERFYSEKDIKQTMKQLEFVEYWKKIKLFKTEEEYFIFRNAWHILGSSFIQFFLNENWERKNICFWWDLWRSDSVIYNWLDKVSDIQHLITESTYWDSNHEDIDIQLKVMEKTIKETIWRGWKVFIPSFALDRSQIIIYLIWKLKKEWKIDKNIPVYLDTPLWIKVLEIYKDNLDYFKKDFAKKIDYKDPNLTLSKEPEQSRILTTQKKPWIYIAASGMAEHWRIRFHLENWISNPKNSILFVWYNVDWTTWDKLMKSKKWSTVTVNWKKKKLLCDIERISLSSHIDRKGILNFIKRNKKLKTVTLFHWGHNQKESLLRKLKKDFKCDSNIAISNFHYKI